MHIEDDIAREGEDSAAERYHKNYQEQLESRIDLVCVILAILTIIGFAIGLYSCPGCSREEFVKNQAAQLDAEGGAK